MHLVCILLNLPIAQDVCYTGRSDRSCFVYFGRLHKVLSVNANNTQEFSGNSISHYVARTSRFRIICVIISGISKGGLGPKGANWAQKGPFGAISALPAAVGCGGIGPDRPRKGPDRP